MSENPDVLRVCSASDFVAEFCIKHPEKLQDLITSGDLETAYTKETYAYRLRQYPVPDTETSLVTVLRHFRQREMVRIAWRDILGWSSIEETLLETSLLAEVCIVFAVEKLSPLYSARFGHTPLSLIVLALGKLGGWELNFSSDVDLMLVYAEDGRHAEFFTRLATAFVRTLDQITEDGFVFRVDLRLRPYGAEGPIVMNLEGLEQYYATEGREWERYALIKARPLTGQESEKTALMAVLRPFVYRKYIDFSVKQALRDLKKTISEAVKYKKMDQHLKLGIGGIREIEFIVQSFQLIYGGRRPHLQTPSIYESLECLQSEKLLAETDVMRLREAYSFLRTVENRLQEWQDRQTHHLPTDVVSRERLCATLNFENWNAFQTVLEAHRQVVHAFFSEFLMLKTESDSDVWTDVLDPEMSNKILSKLGFKNPTDSFNRLFAVRTGHRYRALNTQSKKIVDTFMPMFLLAIAKAEDPDRALERTLQVVDALLRRTVYLSLFLENPAAMRYWIDLCAHSAWITERLSTMPVLLDELLDTRQAEVTLPGRFTEDTHNRLALWKQSRFLRIAAAELSGTITPNRVGQELSLLAEMILKQVLEYSWQGLVERYGKPVHVKKGETGMGILAYGNWGARELGYDSDLDVVFICEDPVVEGSTEGPQKIAAAEFYHRLVQKILSICHGPTLSGTLYQLDMRLRPSGEGLPLVTLAAFTDYQLERAALWEHQALVRARCVLGGRQLKHAFFTLRQNILQRPRSRETLGKEISTMREKMRNHLNITPPFEKGGTGGIFALKHGIGGIIDIEFIVQYGVLAWGNQYPELTNNTGTLRLLSLFGKLGLLSKLHVKHLRAAYVLYIQLLHHAMLNQTPPLVPHSQVLSHPSRVQAVWEALVYN